ncbi:MAG: hypothetical protein Q8O87_02355 [bacterium]|nr:hypothetical protein [bacterium]
MARKKSEFVSSFGTAFKAFQALANAVLDAGGADEDLRFDLNQGLREKVVGFIISARHGAKQAAILTVDYSSTLEQMIQAGRYDWVNSDINEKNFPLNLPAGFPTKVQVIPELIHFNRVMSSDQAITEIKRRGLRPATIWEMLAFGEHNPDLQRQFSIIALGWVWRSGAGGRRVPSLAGSAAERKLKLHWFDAVWHGRCRFLAVREVQPR